MVAPKEVCPCPQRTWTRFQWHAIRVNHFVFRWNPGDRRKRNSVPANFGEFRQNFFEFWIFKTKFSENTEIFFPGTERKQKISPKFGEISPKFQTLHAICERGDNTNRTRRKWKLQVRRMLCMALYYVCAAKLVDRILWLLNTSMPWWSDSR